MWSSVPLIGWEQKRESERSNRSYTHTPTVPQIA